MASCLPRYEPEKRAMEGGMEGSGVFIQADQCPQAVQGWVGGCVCVCTCLPCVFHPSALTDELKRATESYTEAETHTEVRGERLSLYCRGSQLYQQQ